MITRIMRAFAMFASGFYIGYITSEVGFERESVIAESLALLTAGKVLMALLNGRILSKSGTRLVIVLSALQNTAYMALMLLTPALGITAVRLVYFFMGMQDATIMSGYFAWSIEYAPDNKRPVYIGLTNTASLVSSFAPVLGGFILERSSYPAIFALGLGAAVIVLVLALSLVEPRRAKMKG
jgi:MFS family permease